MDNNPNWGDAPITNSTSHSNISYHSSTCLQSKPQHSNNLTNKQLANILDHIAIILNDNQTSSPNTNLRRTKAYILNILSGTKPNKLNNFLFQYYLYFHTNFIQFDIVIAKLIVSSSIWSL